LLGRRDRRHAKIGRLSSQLHLDAGNCLPVALCYQNVRLGHDRRQAFLSGARAVEKSLNRKCPVDQ
jgi:hypothetical protein